MVSFIGALGMRLEGGTRVDAAKFLSDLSFELKQIEQEIRVLNREAATRCLCGFEPGLSASELEPFRRSNRDGDRTYCPQ